MQPFDLERALAGDKVVCRDPDYTVLSISYNPHNVPHSRLCVEVLTPVGRETAWWLYKNGRVLRRGIDSSFDLFMPDGKEDAS